MVSWPTYMLATLMVLVGTACQETRPYRKDRDSILSLTEIRENTRDDVEMDWQEIPERSSAIVFWTPSLEGGVNRSHFAKSEWGGTAYGLHFLSSWVGPSGVFPRAQIQLARAGPRGLFTVRAIRTSLEDYTKQLKLGAGLHLGEKRRFRNRLGPIKYLRFGYDPAECISFSQFMRNGWRDRLFGYYCVDAEQGLSSDRIVAVLNAIDVAER